MQKKHRMLIGFLLGVFTTLILSFLGLFILGMLFINGKVPLFGMQKTTNPDVIVDNSKKIDLENTIPKLKTIQEIISQAYLFEVDNAKLEDGIYSGFVNGLGDPYSVYYNEEDFNTLTEETTGQYEGIGAVVGKNPTNGAIKIVRVFEGSPAMEAGLKPDDIIYKVNGEDVTGIEQEILVKTHIRGEAGTSFNMTVLRGERGEEVELTLTRRAIEIPTVTAKMLDNNIGYVSVAQFDTVTYEQFKTEIEKLREQGMEKMVVDLRNNPGGVLDGVVDMLDYLLPDGLLVYTADKNGNGTKYYSDDGKELNIPIAVLINDNSASASEVFAGAMRDFGRAELVGIKTFGKGIVQNVIPLQDGTAVKITTQHYYTPTGFDLHGKGIEPDVEVELDENAVIGEESDNQLNKAIELLN